MNDQLKELTKAIEKAAIESGDGDYDFQGVAKKIAAVSIDYFADEVLEKGLAIAKAVADFSVELERAG